MACPAPKVSTPPPFFKSRFFFVVVVPSCSAFVLHCYKEMLMYLERF